MYKLVCIDLDGTLLDDKKEISERTINLLEKLLENGIMVLIATGRHYYMVVDFLKDLNTDILVCANNGAMCRYKNSGDLFSVHYVANSDVNKIVKIAREERLNSYIYVDSFIEDYNLIVEDNLPKLSHFEERIVDRKVTEERIKHFKEVDLSAINSALCVAYLDEKEKISRLYNRFIHDNSLVKNVYTIPDGRGVMEFQSLKSDKWNAILEYIDSLGISTSEVIAFGDEFNDVNMVKYAGLGFAMKNGVDSVKSVADRITKYTNNEEGVYFELMELFPNILGE